jgi:hypothetical protein
LRSIDAVEVGFIAFIEVSSTFKGQSTASNGRGNCNHIRRGSFFAAFITLRRRSASTHFCALLFQNSFARKANAVTFDGKHFYQHLIALFQFIANILNAMLGDFAYV